MCLTCKNDDTLDGSMFRHSRRVLRVAQTSLSLLLSHLILKPAPAMSSLSSGITNIAAYALKWSPSAWLKSWLLYLGIQTHVRSTIDPELKPLHNVCEYLNAVHIYADEARQGKVRYVEAHHFCSHVRKGTPDSVIKGAIHTDSPRFTAMPCLRLLYTRSPPHWRRIHDPQVQIPHPRSRRTATLAFARVRSQVRHARPAHASNTSTQPESNG